MKHICISIFFLFLAQVVLGQGWEPVINHYKCNYRTSNSDLPIVLYGSDSVNIAGDVVYTISHDYEICPDWDYGNRAFELGSGYIYTLVPPGTFKTHYAKNKLSRYFISEHDSDLIRPFSSVGDSWLFNANYKAKVIDKRWTHFLDIDDSVKTILLGNKDTIQLSQMYGIIKYPLFNVTHQHYLLAGIEPTEHGFHYPYAKDIFNYDVGDKFEYSYTAYPHLAFFTEFIGFTNQSKSIEDGIQQWQVMNKQVKADGYVYRIKGFYKGSSAFWAFDTTVAVSFNNWRFKGDASYRGVMQFGRYGRSHKYNDNAKYIVPIYEGSDSLYEKNKPTDGDGSEWTYVDGLGCVYYFTKSLTGFVKVSLNAYRKKDDAYGNFDHAIVLPSNTEEVSFSIYPVPAANNFYIRYISPIRLNAKIELTDINGKIMLPVSQYSFAKGNGAISIDTKPLANGIYFLRLGTDGVSKIFKIIVMR